MVRLSFRFLLVALFGCCIAAAVISSAQEQVKQVQAKSKGAADPQEVAISPDDGELKKLLKQRYNEVVNELKYRQALYESGRGGIKSFQEVAARLLESGNEVFETADEKTALLVRHLELMKHIEADAIARHAAAEGNAADVANARYYRIDAEIKILRGKGK